MYLTTRPNYRLFDSFFNDEVFEAKKSNAVNIVEKEKVYQINVEVPGVKKEDVNIELKDNVLILNIERKKEEVSEKDTYHVRQIGEYKVSRQWKLSDDVNTDSVDAKLSDGILSITLEKKAETQPKQITIH